MLAEVGSQLDPTRTHFLGKLPYADYKRVLQVSAAHGYLTYPFVLSWSCLEAMASGCLMVAGDTEPVREVIQHGEQGWLTPALQIKGLALGLTEALALTQAQRHSLRAGARQRAAGFSRASGAWGVLGLMQPADSQAHRVRGTDDSGGHATNSSDQRPTTREAVAC